MWEEEGYEKNKLALARAAGDRDVNGWEEKKRIIKKNPMLRYIDLKSISIHHLKAHFKGKFTQL